MKSRKHTNSVVRRKIFNDPDFGRITDPAMAARYGVDRSVVLRLRLKHGVPRCPGTAGRRPSANGYVRPVSTMLTDATFQKLKARVGDDCTVSHWLRGLIEQELME